MNKEAEFKALCEDVKKCTICHKVKFSPHLVNSDFLSHEKSSDETDYVNKWNIAKWNPNKGYHGDKIDIMIIGQDYGAFENNNDESPTDINLKKLIFNELKIDINDENHRLFLTNMANCYRQKKSTGKINKGCLYLCTHKFMGRLIKIISPKVIIVLGQDTFDALAFCDGAELICANPSTTNKNNNFSTIIEISGYKLVFENGLEIPVFPVYHTGKLGNMNSSKNQKTNNNNNEENFDWKKIAEHLKRRP